MGEYENQWGKAFGGKWDEDIRSADIRRVRDMQEQVNTLQAQLQQANIHIARVTNERDAAALHAFEMRDQIALECLKAFLGRFGDGAEAATKFSSEGLAKSAYEMADAMMKERIRSMPQPTQGTLAAALTQKGRTTQDAYQAYSAKAKLP